MAINKDSHTIDLMLGIPEQEDRSDWYKFMEPLLRDEESKSMFKMPAQYMLKISQRQVHMMTLFNTPLNKWTGFI